MELKPGYKNTEAGVIPDDWSVAELRSVVRHHNSGVYKKGELYGKGSNIVGVSDLYGINCVDGQRFAEVPLSPAELAKYTLATNDLLYGESSLVRDGIARTVYVTERGAGTAFAWHTRRFSVNQQALDSAFTCYYLQSHRARKHMMDQCIQTAITGINTDAYFGCPLLLLPLPEQRAIAEALSDADALIAGLERLVAKKRDLKQAAMQQLLTGRTRLPGFKGKWELLNMAEKSQLKARIGWQGLTTAEYLDAGDYYLVTGTDFVDGQVSWETCPFVDEGRYAQDKYIQLKPGDVLLTKDGTIGKVAYVDSLPGPATLNSGVFVVRPRNSAYAPQFLYHVLSSRIFDDFLTRLQAGSTITHLYQKDFTNFTFQAPGIPEQTAIAEVLSDADAEIASQEARLAKTRDLKQGMMQELLTGRTRLV